MNQIILKMRTRHRVKTCPLIALQCSHSYTFLALNLCRAHAHIGKADYKPDCPYLWPINHLFPTRNLANQINTLSLQHCIVIHHAHLSALSLQESTRVTTRWASHWLWLTMELWLRVTSVTSTPTSANPSGKRYRPHLCWKCWSVQMISIHQSIDGLLLGLKQGCICMSWRRQRVGLLWRQVWRVFL